MIKAHSKKELTVPEDDFKVVAYKQEWNEKSKLHADYTRREDIKIKDVAMNHVLPFLPGKSLMKFSPTLCFKVLEKPSLILGRLLQHSEEESRAVSEM
uniref:Uncharacterized protein n=1 Tax=Solanum tuberosum TaxID=4113 RepID=M1DNF0_SOLTU